jgi:hypothetical protein
MIASIRIGIAGSSDSTFAAIAYSGPNARAARFASCRLWLLGGAKPPAVCSPPEDSRAEGGGGDDGQPGDQRNQSAPTENKALSGLEHASLRSYTR